MDFFEYHRRFTDLLTHPFIHSFIHAAGITSVLPGWCWALL